MNKEEILSGVKDIFHERIGTEPSRISYETSPNNLEEWNSINNLVLITAIEERFKVQFTVNHIFNMQSVGDICDITRELMQS